MRDDIGLQEIRAALKVARVEGFTGEFEPLGGGEVNNTYKLDCGDRQIILRIARDEGQKTLIQEARALRLLNLQHIPRLIFFDKDNLLNKRLWILESYIPGNSNERLTLKQFESLGSLFAEVHKTKFPEFKINLREHFLDLGKHFGDEEYLIKHPDPVLKELIQKAYSEFERLQPNYDAITPALIHLDATPSNILADGNSVGLIDWEFSIFGDPMCDFAGVYYEDMERNRGKWHIQIHQEEKTALFSGYEKAGGEIDEERIRFWIIMDKLAAAVFLYWRLNVSTRKRTPAETDQFELDFNNLVVSLKQQ